MTLRALELLTFWVGAAAVVFAMLSALAGIGAWYFAERVGTIKEAAANERAATLEIRVAEQQERAANAEKELLELQDRARPRTLDATARERMVHWLGASNPNGPIILMVHSGVETSDFATALRGALHEAKWVVSDVRTTLSSGRPPTGLRVYFNADEAPTRALVLQNALGTAGFPALLIKRDEAAPGEVVLHVGLKP